VLIDVALPVPLFRSFTYRVPADAGHVAVVGSRVVVPFRGRDEIGIIVGAGEPREGVAPRDAIAVPDMEPVFRAPMLELCRWISDYYVVPLGVVLRSALPAALTGVDVPVPKRKTRRIVAIARELPSLLERDQLFARSRRQREAYEVIESLGGRAATEQLGKVHGFSSALLKKLVDRGLATVEEEVVDRDPFATRPTAGGPPPSPTPAQRAAIEAMKRAPAGEVFLLHGVTGSGKTLVYIELLREVVSNRGRGAIVLVPEIALTPQTVDRFRGVFGDDVAVLHSALSEGERYDAWEALRKGDRRIAVGARSAIFAPIADLGAVIVDEEHEGSYKQGEAPRYHAREVAIVRGRLEGAVVTLGSATPSLESWVNAGSGKYQLLSLPHRVGGGSLPSVEVVDLRIRGERGELPRAGPGAGGASGGWNRGDPGSPGQGADAAGRAAFRSVISAELEEAMEERIGRGEQSILLLNRRGYASFVQCPACGDVMDCPSCSITLTHHRAPERLVCHYCQHQEGLPETCRRCGGLTMRQRGIGTQQVERLIGERFASARIARMDVDTTSGKWAHAEILDRVGAGTVDILLGTQMIAKGLDFPNVTLVGVVDADVGINLPDFRASERCFQLLSQVAGRAGRGPRGGRVIIQTRLPGHHAVRCALQHDYEGFVAEELPGREEPPYPPVVRIANVVFSGLAEEPVAKLALSAADWLQRLLRSRGAGVALVGPAPSPIERIKNRWRWHLLLKAEQPAALTRVGRYFVERFPVPRSDGLRIAFDRDPVALL
jgi:primosomal protein N' (replication factor Y) (superfamily II helicase)